MNEKVALIYSTYDFIAPAGGKKKTGAFPPVAIENRLSPPLGPLYLAAVLEQENIAVSFLDTSFLKDSSAALQSLIKRDEPMVAGLYVSTVNLPLVKDLIRQIRVISPKTTIIIGGPHVHFEPEAVNYLDADFGIVSDAEFSFRDLVRAVFNNSDTSSIPNVIRRANGGILVNRLQQIENLDALPFPARHLWPYKTFSAFLDGNTAIMLSSRGCVFDCSFCAIPQRGSYRMRSAANIMEELRQLAGSGIRSVDFVDDLMTFDKQRMIELSDALIKEKLKIRWACMSRVDTVDKKLLYLMKKAGCTHIKFGIESGSERVRNQLVGKHISIQQIKEALENSRRAGLLTAGYFVLGMPGETKEEIQQTVSCARTIGVDYVDFHIATLFPGSRMFSEALKSNALPANIWQHFSDGGELRYSLLDKQSLREMRALRARTMRSYYFRPAFLLEELFKRTKNLSSLRNKFRMIFNHKYNAYLSYKSFAGYNPRISMLWNYCYLKGSGFLKQAKEVLENMSDFILNQASRFFFSRIKSSKPLDVLFRKTVFQAMNFKYRAFKLHLNHDCNLKCKNCYSDFAAADALSFAEIRSFIDQLKPFGNNLSLHLLGGEPFLREDIFEIISYAGKKIKDITVFTNATLITAQTAFKAKQAGASAAIINLYSCYPQIHDGITQSPGSWAKTVEGIRHFSAAGLPVYTFTVLMEGNKNHLKQIDDFARTLGSRTIYFPYIRQQENDSLCIQDQQSFQEAITWAYKKSPAYQNRLKHMLRKRSKACSAFVSSVTIMPDGSVTPCPFLRLKLGNIRQQGLYDILNNAYRNQELLDFLSIPQECRSCSLVKLCGGGCKAYRFNNQKSCSGKDPNCRGPYKEKIPLEKLGDYMPYIF